MKALISSISRTLPALAVVLTAFGASAGDRAPVVVELFTSQSCYSCPPAERFLGELAKRDGVLALEFHVDYWDELVYGSAGKWKDVFSKPAYTARQRDYNKAIRRTASVYTPQMVIDGRFEAVGSREGSVNSAVRRARKQERERLKVAISGHGQGGVSVMVDGKDATPAKIWLVRFVKARTTEVRAGENKGKSLTNHHVVTELRPIGEWRGRTTTVDVSDVMLAAGESCAVLVQDARPGPVMGAAMCPMPSS